MAAMRVRDDRGRVLLFPTAPRRVVSLVPSDTYTIARLAGVSRLVGRTTYCEEPKGEIEAIPTVGGTKDASVEAIRALAPDLVIANQEENTKSTLEALAQAGVPVFVVFPKRVDDGIALVARLARILGVDRDEGARELVRTAHRTLQEALRLRETLTPVRAFCPIWADPLMTIHGDTYISDAMDLAGAQNVFADRERRYPLAADLGKAPALPKTRVLFRDTRYPRITDEELVARAPELVLLPDEPHPFSEDDAERFRKMDLPAARAGKVVRLSGKDLCWYGAWAIAGIPRLRDTIASLRRDSPLVEGQSPASAS
jgi:ABC-type Fe3+-hydroxamate transport system substrate-binding protein